MNALFAAFERASLFGLAALLVALVAQVILDGRVPASWRVWIWRVALLQTALALLPLSPLRLAVLPPQPQVSVQERKTQNLVKSSPLPSPRFVSPPLTSSAPSNAFLNSAPAITPGNEAAPVQAQALKPLPAVQPAGPFPLRTILALIYALGLIVQLGLLARSFGLVRRLLGPCVPIEDAKTSVKLNRIVQKMSVSVRPRLLQSEGSAPFLVGILRPAIVVPRALVESPRTELDAVLSHELAHLKRRDLAWNALLWPVQSLLWFHPLVWVSRRFLALETESACDEMVLSSTGVAPKSYGALLLNTMNNPTTPLTVGITDGFFALKTRLQRLNQAPKRPHRVFQIVFTLVLLATLGALVPLRFVSRADSDADKSQPPKSGVKRVRNGTASDEKTAALVSVPIRGTVRDRSGKPVASATVYAMQKVDKRNEVIATSTSNPAGSFSFLAKMVAGETPISVFADAGRRGMGDEVTTTARANRKNRSLAIRVLPNVRATLRVLDPQGHPVPQLPVHLWFVGRDSTEESTRGMLRWMAIPRPLLIRFQATTNARGEATFPALPSGPMAQFWIGEKKPASAWSGRIAWRGRTFAPLTMDESVSLKAPQVSTIIRLLDSTGIQGRIALPDGRGAANAAVWVWKVQAADGVYHLGERRGNGRVHTRTNAAGQYSLDGLRPGRYLIQVFPDESLMRDFVGPIFEKVLTAKTNRIDLALTRGVVVEGKIVAQGTKQPVKGQILDLHDPRNRYYRTVATDARGGFRFHVLAGQQHLRLDSPNNGYDLPDGFALPAKSEFDFTLADGSRREFTIEMPTVPLVKSVTGQVVGPNGAPAAGAMVRFRSAGGFGPTLLSIRSNQAGHFSLPLKDSARPLQLFADAGELTTPRPVIALSGEVVKLQLQDKAWASLEGRVLDQSQQPIFGAMVELYTVLGDAGISNQTILTDKNGRYRFSRLRPETGALVQVTKSRFSRGFKNVLTLKVGEVHRLDISLSAAPKTLTGLVLDEDGTPARGFGIWASGQIAGARTREDGRFFLPQVLSGPISVHVSKSWNNWEPFSARGGDKNLVIRLSKTGRSARWGPPQNGNKKASLVGKTAPEIRAVRWGNGKAVPLSSLRGQVVLLALDWFHTRRNHDLDAFARSFQSRVRVIGVQSNPRVQRASQFPIDVDGAERDLGFPIALDSPVAKGGSGQTFELYGNAPYVVIGRDGKILYAGSYFDRAMILAANAAKA